MPGPPYMFVMIQNLLFFVIFEKKSRDIRKKKGEGLLKYMKKDSSRSDEETGGIKSS